MTSKEITPPEPSVETYTSLLSETIKVWKNSPENEINIRHPESDNQLDQYVLAEGDNPKIASNLTIGFCMNSSEAYFQYKQKFREGFVNSFGHIITIQHYFESGNRFESRQNRGTYKRGPIIRKFSPIGAQSVANEFNINVLDTIDVDLTDKEELQKLEALGYGKRHGYQIYEKMYTPKVK